MRSRRHAARLRHQRFWGLVTMLLSFIGMALLFGGAIAHDAGDHTLQVVCWMGSFAMLFGVMACIGLMTDYIPD